MVVGSNVPPFPNSVEEWQAILPTLFPALTPREVEVAAWRVMGSRGQGLADCLVVEPCTIKEHTARIRSKLGVSKSSEIPHEVMRRLWEWYRSSDGLAVGTGWGPASA